MSQYYNTQLTGFCLMFLRFLRGFFTIETSSMRLNQLFEKLTTKPIKREGNYFQNKLKIWRKCN